MINKDGTLDFSDPSGGTSHAVIDISEPNNVYGTQTTHLGKVNGVQVRYPDGSISTTEIRLQGKLVNDQITRTWYNKFQKGQFGWTV